MSTINGTGTKYYGWQPVRFADRTAYATNWFVLFYAPILPLRRHKLKVLTDRTNEGFLGGASDHYQILGETALVWSEVLGTWWAFLRGLLVIVVPFVVFLAISQHQDADRMLGRPVNRALGLVSVVCLVWSLVAAVAIPLRAWRRSRG